MKDHHMTLLHRLAVAWVRRTSFRLDNGRSGLRTAEYKPRGVR